MGSLRESLRASPRGHRGPLRCTSQRSPRCTSQSPSLRVPFSSQSHGPCCPYFYCHLNMETKIDKEKSNKGIWRSDAPEASQEQTRDVPGTPGTFGPDLCVNAKGTDGTYHGTDGTCARDRRDAHQGVSRQNSLCLFVFFLFPLNFLQNQIKNTHRPACQQ